MGLKADDHHATYMTPRRPTPCSVQARFGPGFYLYLAELAKFNEADFADEEKMAALNERFDIIQLGPVPPRS
ncbi:MAG: hypothetical protein AAFV69_08670 [Pseudomonadota bacterium]